MAAPSANLTHVLEFPEGTFLLIGRAPYFLPRGHDVAYLGYGEHTELLGKHGHKLPTRAAGFKKYDLTYEFEGSALLAARLISPLNRSKGVEASAETRQALAAALDSGALALRDRQDPPLIRRATQFIDGRMLLMMENMPGQDFRTLYVGKPGAFEQVPVKTYVQGGAHFIFTTVAGEKVDLPSGLMGPGPGDFPSWDDQPMGYINHERLDFAKLGFTIPQAQPHLDPFCPELNPAPARGPQP